MYDDPDDLSRDEPFEVQPDDTTEALREPQERTCQGMIPTWQNLEYRRVVATRRIRAKHHREKAVRSAVEINKPEEV